MPGLLQDPSTGIGPMILAYVSPDRNDLCMAASPDGATWSEIGPVTNGDSSVTQSSSTAPALCMFNDAYVMAYIANNGTNHLQVTRSADGQNWSVPAPVMGLRLTPVQFGKVPLSSKVTPALAANWNGLILTFVADDGTDDLYTTSSRDGVHWSDVVPVTGLPRSATAPALINNMLVAPV